MTSIDLHGRWSDSGLYQGSMEMQNVVFMPDGSGWWEWMNARNFEAHRLRWQVISPGHLEVHVVEYLSGTAHIEGGRPIGRYGLTVGGTLVYRLERQHDEDKRNTTGYTIAPARDALDKDVTVLEIAQEQTFSVLRGRRFALVRRTVSPTETPWFRR
jgi:hypothetical protein